MRRWDVQWWRYSAVLLLSWAGGTEGLRGLELGERWLESSVHLGEAD